MRIGFIGAGKVGFTFGRYIAEKRELVREKTDGALCLDVGGYFSASRQSAELAAEFTETCVYDSLEQLCEYSEIIFLTVPDGQIGEVWKSIKDLDIRGRIICHDIRYFLRYNRGGSLWLFDSSYVCNKFKVRIL